MIPRLQLLAAAVLFSTGGAAIKLTHLSGWQIACFRSLVATLVLLAVVPQTRRIANWPTLLVAVAYCGALLFFVLATKLTSAANAIFLQAASPLYVLILSPWVLGEPLRRADLVLMAALAAGLTLAFLGQPEPSVMAPNPALGNILGALSGVCWAAALIALRRLARNDASAGIRTAAAGNLVTFLVCLPVVAGMPLALQLPDAGAILYLGVFQVALPYLVMVKGFSKVPAVEGSGLLLAESALNPVWAWLIAGETQPLLAVCGGAIILTATLLNLLWRSTRVRG